MCIIDGLEEDLVLPITRNGVSDIKIAVVFFPAPLLRQSVWSLIPDETDVRFDPFQATPMFVRDDVPPVCQQVVREEYSPWVGKGLSTS